MKHAKGIWVLCRCKGRQEGTAARNCIKQGFEPLRLRIKNELTGRVEELFPGYLFVKTSGQWHALNNTYGVIGVVMRGERPDTIPNSEIKRLKNLARNENGLIELPDAPTFEQGKPIKIKAGPFRDTIGICKGMSQMKRVKVLFDFLGQKVELELKRKDVELLVA